MQIRKIKKLVLVTDQIPKEDQQQDQAFKEWYTLSMHQSNGLARSESQLIRSIELANEDHCGPCGGAAIKKILK